MLRIGKCHFNQLRDKNSNMNSLETENDKLKSSDVDNCTLSSVAMEIVVLYTAKGWETLK